MKKNIEFLFLIIIFLNFSEGFRPVGVLTGIPSSYIVSVSTLLICVIYLIKYNFDFKFLLRIKLFRLWLILLLVYPSISFLISYFFEYLSLNELIYWFSYNLLYGLLMVGATLFSFRNSYAIIKKMAFYSILITLVGFILNYTNYGFTKRVLEFSNAGAASHEKLFRAVSFFSNPNAAALSIIIYYIIYISNNEMKTFHPVKYVLLSVAVTGMVFLTGSRTSLLILALILLLYVIPSIVKEIMIRYNFSKSLSYLNLIIGGFFFLTVFISTLPFLSNFYSKLMGENILARFDFLTNLISGNSGLSQDRSVNYRLSIIPDYLERICENPIFGYGPQVVRNNLVSNVFENTSQNLFIEVAFIFGIPYMIFTLYIIFLSYQYALRYRIKAYETFNILKVFIVLIVVLSFSMNNVFWLRAVVIALGFIIGYTIKMGYLKKINI